MGIILIKRLITLVVLLLLQVLVFNYVHFLGYATPYLYIYLILKMPVGTSRNEVLLWGFVTGLCVDVFSNTPGVSAAATTLYALVQPWLVRLFAPREHSEDMDPGFRSMGISLFWKYVICSVLLHHALLLTIETFTFIYWLDLLISILSSSILTILGVMAIESVRKD